MNYLQRLEHWGDTHHPRWLDIVRVLLGIFLCYKGVAFATHSGDLMDQMKGAVPFSGLLLLLLSHYIIYAHLGGGFLLAMGMLTRVACIIQIPILIGALFFLTNTWFKPFSEIVLVVLVLAALLFFLIVGSGPWSWDALSAEKKKEEKKEGSEGAMNDQY